MNRLNRMAAAAKYGAAWLLPAGRRDWAAAVWAEAHEVPPGLAQLAWRAGGGWMLAREALLPRRIGRAALFAAAAATAARAAWPGSPASLATPSVRGYVITMVLLLAGLPLLARPFLGPAGDSCATCPGHARRRHRRGHRPRPRHVRGGAAWTQQGCHQPVAARIRYRSARAARVAAAALRPGGGCFAWTDVGLRQHPSIG